MRSGFTTVIAIVCVLTVGCGTALTRAPEVSNDQLYADDHQWTEGDVRTALWFTRNYPDDIAALGFMLFKFPTYNRHNERFGEPAGRIAYRNPGPRAGKIFHTSVDDLFARIDDPQLRVKMLSLEARERNRMRERERRRHTGTWPYDTGIFESDRRGGQMDDAEIEQRLMDTYR